MPTQSTIEEVAAEVAKTDAPTVGRLTDKVLRRADTDLRFAREELRELMKSDDILVRATALTNARARLRTALATLGDA